MKRKLLGLALAAVTGLAAVVMPSEADAAAYGAAFQVSITYQNVGTTATPVNIDFYPENNGTATSFSAGTLNPKASASLLVGSVTGLGSSFKGSAVLSAEQPVIATVVQFASGIANRPLSNGFSRGASKQLVATVLKNSSNYSTIFSVQNAGAAAANVTVQFFAAGSTTAAHTITVPNLAANAARYFDATQIAELGATFSGSAIVSSSTDVVVGVNELQVNGNGASSFEGTPNSGARVYMPSANCEYVGLFSTFYAVQNASQSAPLDFQVRYKINGQADVIDGPYSLPAGAKRSIAGCAKMPRGSIGSAIVERTNGTGTLVAVGKVAGGNITSSFLGAVEGTGSTNVALPYVRWSPNATFGSGARQRTDIAIQNISSTAATNVRVQYVDRNGSVVGTHTIGNIAAGQKASSNPAAGNALDPCGRFGEYGGGADCLGTSFGGGAIVLADAGSLVTVARVYTGNPTQAGEDYTGMNVSGQ